MSEAMTTEHLEHAEHAEHVAHEGTPFLIQVSMSIAIMAVVAATIGSLETIETAATLGAQNAAALSQSKASDQWAFFQAKSIKKSVHEVGSRQGGPQADALSREARRYEDESKAIKTDAEGFEHRVEEHLHEAEHHEHRHHILTMAVTLLHAAIAIATIAIITKGRKWPWHAGLALTAAGIALAGYAYV
ncbi:DUF4337 family protein [Methylosinus sp. Sm6]|uniref:DUF4337 family protein n=1 Tax=Methylosinus sp. Sm6 TaxID=2866948 RepID=UPI001C9A18C6|nr:DUF4337 family protein [Methylosinus sp. Sm6]MBY6243284.1 DUF4337 domain-containing protein [Methylosinus sp. Sm6]